MTNEEKRKCKEIICQAVAASIVIPDESYHKSEIPLVAIHVKMIISLGAVFGKEINVHAANHLYYERITAAIGKRKIFPLLSRIPILGKFINAATITKTLGWDAANYFDSNNEQSKS